MKKVFTCMIVVALLLLTLCACGAEQLSVECTDGITRKLTIPEMYEMYFAEPTREQPEKLVKGGTIVSGRGTITNVSEPTAYAWRYGTKFPTNYSVDISLDNGVTVSFSYYYESVPKYDFYAGDTVEFKGAVSGFSGTKAVSIVPAGSPVVSAEDSLPLWVVK